MLAAAIVLVGCGSSDDVTTTEPVAPAVQAAVSAAPHQHPFQKSRGPLPVAELRRAKRATARYRDIRNAVADGYADLHVVLPNMGDHFLKAGDGGLLDAKFEAERPELLVYSAGTHGHMELVAVEYAVPLDLSATAPEGFQGTADTWFRDETFHLWTLHAWVWKDNPDGVFNPTNSRVP
jgi:hypothetical protein